MLVKSFLKVSASPKTQIYYHNKEDTIICYDIDYLRDENKSYSELIIKYNSYVFLPDIVKNAKVDTVSANGIEKDTIIIFCH